MDEDYTLQAIENSKDNSKSVDIIVNKVTQKVSNSVMLTMFKSVLTNTKLSEQLFDLLGSVNDELFKDHIQEILTILPHNK